MTVEAKRRPVGASHWTDERIREAERQSSANGRIAGFAQNIWREQGYDEATVQRLRAGLLDGLYEVQRDMDAGESAGEVTLAEATKALDESNATTAAMLSATDAKQSGFVVLGDPGGVPPSLDGGPTARGVAFGVYASQPSSVGGEGIGP